MNKELNDNSKYETTLFKFFNTFNELVNAAQNQRFSSKKNNRKCCFG